MPVRVAAPADIDVIARIHVQSWQTSYRGILPDELLDNLSVERRAEQWQRTMPRNDMFVYVAENVAGEIVGFASGGAERDGVHGYDGEL